MTKYTYIQIDGKLVKHRHCTRCGKLFPVYLRSKVVCSRCNECWLASRREYQRKVYWSMEKEERTQWIKERVKRRKITHSGDKKYHDKKKAYKRMHYYHVQHGRKVKYCDRCGEYKLLTDFLERRGSADGYTDQCRKCIEKEESVVLGGREYRSTYFEGGQM